MRLVNDIQLSPNFKASEFVCKEGKSEVLWDYRLIEKLEALRQVFGNKPIYIVSGYRSEDYNRRVGGGNSSQHLYGKAADIVIKGVSPKVIASEAIKLGFTGVGIYTSFTHVDVRDQLVNKEGRKYDIWHG